MSFERRSANEPDTSRDPTAGTRAGVPTMLACALATLAAILASPTVSAQEDTEGDGVVVIDDLMWAGASNGEDVPWQPARQYCDTLDVAGHGDWRLPTLAELEGLHDPADEANGFIMSPLELPGCCLWSSTSLAELGAEEGGVAGGQRDAPSSYYWGLLFAGGIRYYSINVFPDGQALCVRERDHQ